MRPHIGAAAAIPVKGHGLIAKISNWKSDRSDFVSNGVIPTDAVGGWFHIFFLLGCVELLSWIQSSSQLRRSYCNARATAKNKVITDWFVVLYKCGWKGLTDKTGPVLG